MMEFEQGRTSDTRRWTIEEAEQLARENLRKGFQVPMWVVHRLLEELQTLRVKAGEER